MLQKPASSQPLRVLFPIGALKPDDSLLDPTNTETVYEYYLLENLAIGLLRDDVAEISGYRGLLADRWRQVDPQTWEFHIRQDLKWSDGTPITLAQIAQHLLYLRTANARHLIQLSDLHTVEAVVDKHELQLVFNKPVGPGILHELSLADATLYRVTNSVPNWRITSGPYRLEEFKPSEKFLRLQKNSNCVLIAADSPDTVDLFSKRDRSQLPDVFEKDRADLYLMGAQLFMELPRQWEARGIKFEQGHASTVHFFVINPNHHDAADLKTRKAFVTLIRSALSGAKLPVTFKRDNQMIPLGFGGRLTNYIEQLSDVRILKGKSIHIELWSTYNEFPEFEAAFQKAAALADIDLKVSYADYQSKANQNPPFAKLDIFKGNQKDALGSWSFLFSGSGALAPYRDLIKDELAAIPQADEDERDRLLKQIHQKVLDEAIAVPFAMEPSRVYLADGVDVSRWNPFDMRLRLYEVRVNR